MHSIEEQNVKRKMHSDGEEKHIGHIKENKVWGGGSIFEKEKAILH